MKIKKTTGTFLLAHFGNGSGASFNSLKDKLFIVYPEKIYPGSKQTNLFWLSLK
jgi:hypothetical protein